MATSGPNHGGLAHDGGELPPSAPWSNIEDAVTEDSSSAIWSSFGSEISGPIYIDNFGTFAGVESGDQIDTIKIEVRCVGSSGGEVIWSGVTIANDATFKYVSPLISGGLAPTPTGSLDYATFTLDPSAEGTNIFGSDLINGEFRVILYFEHPGFSYAEIEVDAVRVTLTGTFTGGGGEAGGTDSRFFQMF